MPLTAHEKRKIDEFMKRKGVTPCPGMFSKELAERNRQEIIDYNNLTPEERFKKHKNKHSWRGPKKKRTGPPLTKQEMRERQNARSREWYHRNKEKKNAYNAAARAARKQPKDQPPVAGG